MDDTLALVEKSGHVLFDKKMTFFTLYMYFHSNKLILQVFITPVYAYI